MNFLRSLYKSFLLSRRTYSLLAAIVVCFILSFFLPALYQVSLICLILLIFTVLLDILVLYSRKTGFSAKRITPERLSNGDQNIIQVSLINNYSFTVKAKIIDELPFQFQKAYESDSFVLKPSHLNEIVYNIRPVERGEYEFGDINVFVTSPLGLAERRYIFDASRVVPTYPAFHQMKKYQLMAISNRLNENGTRRLRKLGNSTEFEQIKEYVTGDDYRKVNWKATARKGEIMVNTFTDEKSQHIYCLIDKGRNMKMPFGGMSLLDYAINASLVLTNVALTRQDKAGLLTFSSKPETFLPADRKGMQMELILENLYRQQTHFSETDFEALYAQIHNKIKNRSLLILFTNFESIPGFQRQLPYLRRIAKQHLLLVIFFENTELKALREKPAADLEEIYIQTIADKFSFEKRLIVKELQHYGILSVLTSPEALTINVINKYIELKARQAI
ncbi:MAG: DUF58 domain-containing protein [Bacteroidetes bacterium]|nr:DUF58 domain-containing protein [Bacteroidota bacterium]